MGKTKAVRAGDGQPRVVELIVLIEASLLTIWSLTWLGVATAQSHVDRVGWIMWSLTRAGDLVMQSSLSTTAAVWLSCGAMALVVALAAFGFLTAHRFDRGQIRIAVATRCAALVMLPLTITLPVQFAAYQQTGGWVGDNHGLELIVEYGAFASVLAGVVLLMVTREFVDSW